MTAIGPVMADDVDDNQEVDPVTTFWRQLGAAVIWLPAAETISVSSFSVRSDSSIF